MLRVLKCLVLLMAMLLVVLICLFFQVAFAQASENYAEIVAHIKDASVKNKDYAQEIIDEVNSNQVLVESGVVNTSSIKLDALKVSSTEIKTINTSSIKLDALKVSSTEIKTIKTSSTESDVIGQMLTGYSQIKQNSCPKGKKEGLFIFISFSMPNSLLKKYDAIAKQIGAKLVLRGFKNDSFKETVHYIQAISEQGIMMEVDPMLFKKFGITSVPSFVLVSGDRFDKLVGNVSINYALERFSSSGDLAQNAKVYLERFKAHENK